MSDGAQEGTAISQFEECPNCGMPFDTAISGKGGTTFQGYGQFCIWDANEPFVFIHEVGGGARDGRV